MEIPVQAEYLVGRKIRCITRIRDVDRTKSREAGELAAKKSRYCFIQARTVNRHRWMRRES